MTKKYKQAELVTLSDYIEADKFRTVLPEQRKITPGYSEVPVEISTKKPFWQKLSFKISWDGIIYGFLRGKQDLMKKLGDKELQRILINDWDDKFIIVFEMKKPEDVAFFVTSEEVKTLLEDCRRVPEQKSL